MRVHILSIFFVVNSIASVSLRADEATKAILPVFGKPLKALKLPKDDLLRAQVELGRTLYHEKRLSRDNSISCNSCHSTTGYGVDGEKFSIGFENHLTGRNSPTSFNAFMHISQFWDGRAPSVEEQAKGPILAGGEMAMPSAEAVVAKLEAATAAGAAGRVRPSSVSLGNRPYSSRRFVGSFRNGPALIPSA